MIPGLFTLNSIGTRPTHRIGAEIVNGNSYRQDMEIASKLYLDKLKKNQRKISQLDTKPLKHDTILNPIPCRQTNYFLEELN